MITAQELRNKWFAFFESKGHTIIPSASLVPENDASVLYTMAGMHPLVPYLLGQEHPKGKRLANSQKCIRTGDIEEVGDDTHLTFFEMLGNWSLGDYFKDDQIKWSFEFLTGKEWLNIPLERLAVSVFAGDNDAPRDEESATIWKSLGVPEERIAYLPKEDNWWIAGTSGPCGPDTEMFYWIDDGTPAPVNFQETKDDKRWVEIWNDVFMQYEKKEDGTLVSLSQKNVDTGMGLDRVLTVLNGQSSVYDTELFKPLFDVIALSQEVMSNDEVRQARIIVDHVRAAVFITSDGVEPSNKERGYILRRLLRRAMVYAKLLNLQPHWLEGLVGKVVAIYAESYPELVKDSNRIFETIEAEQNKFTKTLEKGLKEFEKVFKDQNKITGTDAFNLYQTFGFPWELTKELAEAAGQQVNEEEFKSEFKKHQDLSRTASAGEFKGGLASNSEKVVRYHTATHLMHKALREVLGDEVWQKGSNITEERTRFDFTYAHKMTDGQKKEVEDLVNDWIKRDGLVEKEMMPLEKARELGAIGLFGEKYDDVVSVYTISDPKTKEVISREFCGGPHVEHTGQIGTFKIVKEESISAGTRRIKAVIQD
ncbi:MAG: alanine--tRNA ligase [Candidatus Doudnabacteria bacterium]|nr:alanine--tRNA ligase [Candidatus Doudnabacteria bacterium]